jgi:hypothetical protein
MTRLTKLQFLGPLVLFLAVATAEGAAFALAHFPTSEALWYLNLKIFVIFQRSYYLLSPLLGLPYSQLLFIALPLVATASYGLIARRAFPLALAGHLSFIYTAFLIYSQVKAVSHPLAASLIGIAVPIGPDIYLPIVLVGVCIISLAVSHFHYLRQICQAR